jgi:hypothetical protein
MSEMPWGRRKTCPRERSGDGFPGHAVRGLQFARYSFEHRTDGTSLPMRLSKAQSSALRSQLAGRCHFRETSAGLIHARDRWTEPPVRRKAETNTRQQRIREKVPGKPFCRLRGYSTCDFAEAGHARFRARNLKTSLRRRAFESLRPLISRPVLACRVWSATHTHSTATRQQTR